MDATNARPPTLAVVSAVPLWLLFITLVCSARTASAQTYPLTSLIRKTGSDTSWGNLFGHSVAVDGDTMVTGAFAHSQERGAAYVFYRNQGGTNQWGQVKKLVPSSQTALDDFGYSVAISGDTIVVGAPGKDGTDAWGLVTSRIPTDSANFDQFGHAVAISGDRIIATTIRKSSSRGAAYVFGRNTSGTNVWGQITKLVASDEAADHQFGITAALDGSRAVIGAQYFNVSYGVYVFDQAYGGTDNWGERRKITQPPGSQRGLSLFGGLPISVSGDYVAVGDPYYSLTTSTGPGAAYVFGKDQGGTNNWGLLRRFTGAPSSYFGAAVALNGDILAVTAPLDHMNAGTVSLYMRQGGVTNWGKISTFFPTDSPKEFGRSVALSDDATVVGAPSVAYTNQGPVGYAYVLGYSVNPPPPFINATSTWEPIRQIIFN